VKGGGEGMAVKMAMRERLPPNETILKPAFGKGDFSGTLCFCASVTLRTHQFVCLSVVRQRAAAGDKP